MADTQDYLSQLVKEAADTIGESNLKSILNAIIGSSTESELLTINLVYGVKITMHNQTIEEYEKQLD
tara:strand:+ start:19047 stop:19247 length:201 start_codon:yes stop_codon:yes gene_type:complete